MPPKEAQLDTQPFLEEGKNTIKGAKEVVNIAYNYTYITLENHH